MSDIHGGGGRPTGPHPEIDCVAMRAHADRVLNSAPFIRAPRMRRFLNFLIEETLAGRAARLKEYTIAVSVFGKPHDFEPGTSAVVRVEAGRLRRLLAEYYAEHGLSEKVQLHVPKGTYVPTLVPAHVAAMAVGESGSAISSASAVEKVVSPVWPARERRLVTVLSCAMVSETLEYSVEGEFLGLFEQAMAACTEVAIAHGGQVDASASDRLIVYFGWPNALEDAAGRALTAALEMVPRVQSVAGSAALALRIGVATSEAITVNVSADEPRIGPPVIGEAPALATKMQVRAPLNGVIVAESTRRRVGEAFEFLPAGPLEPGDGGPSLLWLLLRATPVLTRFRAVHVSGEDELVGRKEEMALLLSRWGLSADGEGQAANLVGEAGIGKSRLAEAALERIGSDAFTLRIQCSPHHVNSTLFPVLELLRTRIDLASTGGDLDEAAGRFLSQLGMDVGLNHELLSALLSGRELQRVSDLTSGQRKDLTLKLLTEIVLETARRRPTVLLVEDVHWADPTTKELLQDLVRVARASKLLVLMTSRPEAASDFAQEGNVTSVRLTRLPRGDCSTLIHRLADLTAVSPVTKALILERADGIPLFLEELTKSVLSAPGQDRLQGAVPESLADLLAAQLDRLGMTRSIAQIASVIGRSFPGEMIALAAGRSTADTDSALDQLVAAGILVRDRADNVQLFSFRHALLRDAAYHSLLEPNRRELHLRVGRMLLDSFPDVGRDHPEVVAHHLAEGAHADEAIPYWIQAARRAASRHALIEASSHFRNALRALTALPAADPERELELLLELGRIIRDVRGYADPELLPIYKRARALAAGLGRDLDHANALYGLWTFAAGAGRWQWALSLAHKFRRHAVAIGGMPQGEVEALRLLGASDVLMGNFVSGRDRLARCIAAYDAEQHGPRFGFDPGPVAVAYLAWTVWHLGDEAAAARYAGQALALAESKSHPPTLAMVLAWLTFYAVCKGDLDAVDRYSARLQDVGAERDCRYWEPFGAACAEWSGFGRDADPRRLERLLAFAAGFREHYLTSCLLLMAADLCLRMGRWQQGLELVDQTQAYIARHDERVWEAEAYRLKAELLAASRAPDHSQVRALLDQAITVAQAQGATALVARAQAASRRLDQQVGHKQRRKVG